MANLYSPLTSAPARCQTAELCVSYTYLEGNTWHQGSLRLRWAGRAERPVHIWQAAPEAPSGLQLKPTSRPHQLRGACLSFMPLWHGPQQCWPITQVSQVRGLADAAACLCQPPVAPGITGMPHSCLHVSYAAFLATAPSDPLISTCPLVPGNFSTVAIQCLEKCPTDNSKFTFTCDKHTFNYLVDGGYSEC